MGEYVIMAYLNEAKKVFTAGIVAVAANFGVIAFSRRTAEISTQFEPLSYTAVGIATLVSAAGAYGVLQLLKMYTDRPLEYFFYISGAVLIGSFWPIGHRALEVSEAGMAEINILGLLHVVTALVLVGVLAKFELMER